MRVTGYRRPDGTVGVRNEIVVISSVLCANEVTEAIAGAVPGVVSMVHQHGCSVVAQDAAHTRKTLAGLGRNPNVAAVLVVSLGCETVSGAEVVEEIVPSGKPVELVVIQEMGGNRKAAARGAEIMRTFRTYADGLSREEVGFEEIVLGTECGGSDACSGLSANPAVGAVADLVVAEGGTAILSETTELIGAEHLLARRAADERIGRRILEIVDRVEARAKEMGVDLRGANPAPGNIKGGLTTLEEKSLGCIAKGGTSPVMEVVEYADRAAQKGLVVMDTPGNDAESLTGMAAGGAQVMVFTTGRGNPLGFPIAPVIKVASNTEMFRRMEEDMDINAGTVIDGEEAAEQVGRRIFDLLVEVINGRRTKSESWSHRHIALNRLGPTF